MKTKLIIKFFSDVAFGKFYLNNAMHDKDVARGGGVAAAERAGGGKDP